jgi:hypothetical protein
MTHEFVVWVLLAAMVGAIWILTCVILTKDRTAVRRPDEETDEDNRTTSSPKSAHRRIAA